MAIVSYIISFVDCLSSRFFADITSADGVQFFLLPIVLGSSLLSLGVANTLYAIAFGWYCYITHLGYRGKK